MIALYDKLEPEFHKAMDQFEMYLQHHIFKIPDHVLIPEATPAPVRTPHHHSRAHCNCPHACASRRWRSDCILVVVVIVVVLIRGGHRRSGERARIKSEWCRSEENRRRITRIAAENTRRTLCCR